MRTTVAGIAVLALAAALAAGCGRKDSGGGAPAGPAPGSESIAQKTCPVTGALIDPGQSVEVKGRKIYGCSPDCLEKIKADPGKYVKKVDDELAAMEAVKAAPPPPPPPAPPAPK